MSDFEGTISYEERKRCTRINFPADFQGGRFICNFAAEIVSFPNDGMFNNMRARFLMEQGAMVEFYNDGEDESLIAFRSDEHSVSREALARMNLSKKDCSAIERK